MFSKKYIGIFLSIYTLIRVFSYFFSPETPLYAANPVNTIASAIVLLVISYWLSVRNPLGWYGIALEIILGGAGGYLAVGPLSLRTCLLLISIPIYFGQKLREHKLVEIFRQNKTVVYVFSALFIVVGISAIHGFLAGHGRNLIFSDTIPYLFLLYYFPLKELLNSQSFPAEAGSRSQWENLSIFQSSIIAAIIGNFILIIFTFISFSSGMFVLQDSYYHWYRDVALGKITELPFHFFRLVLNEHLLLVPVLLLFLGKLTNLNEIKKYRNREIFPYFLISLFLIIILSLNLTRIYMLALAFGYLFLFSRHYWKRWLIFGFVSCFLFFVSFTSIHLLASRGQSLGWELFGLRLQSIVQPSIEDSSLSRKLLLPKIVEKIKADPVVGTGLGDTVTVYSQVLKKEITTPHFDWGYLEITAEMGILGSVMWLLVISYLLLVIYKNTSSEKKSLFASLAALFVINLTSPALFHVMGIIWIVFLLAYLSKFSVKLSESSL